MSELEPSVQKVVIKEQQQVQEEQSPEAKKMRFQFKETPSLPVNVSVNLDNIVTTFLEHFIDMKLYHFQTTSFGRHVALNTYIPAFLANLDLFAEIAQGNEQRSLQIGKWAMQGEPLNDTNALEKLVRFEQFLRTQVAEYSKNSKSPELLNVRDDMIGKVAQLRYLFKFK